VYRPGLSLFDWRESGLPRQGKVGPSHIVTLITSDLFPNMDSETSKSDRAEQPGRRVRRRFAYGCGTLLVLSVAGVFLLPFAVREGIEYLLRQQGEENPHIEEIYLNPFTGVLEVRGLTGGERATDLLRAGHVRFELDWGELLRQNILVKTVIIEDVTLHVRQRAEGQWQVGKMTFDPRTGEVDTEFAYGVGTDAVTLRNVELLFERPDLRLAVNVNEGSLGELRSWQAEDEAAFEADLNVNGGTLNVTGITSPFGDAVQVDARFALTELPVATLAAMAEALGIYDLSGTLEAALEAKFVLDPSGNTVRTTLDGQATLNRLAAGYETYSGAAKALAWDGRIVAEGDLSAPTVNAEGALILDDATGRSEDEGMSGRVAHAGWTGNADADFAETFTTAVSGEFDLTGFSLALPGASAGQTRIERVTGSAESLSLTAGDSIQADGTNVSLRLDGIAIDELLREAGSLRIAHAEVNSASLGVSGSDGELTLRGALRGLLDELTLTEVDPELPEARLARAELDLTDAELKSGEDALLGAAEARILLRDGSARFLSTPLAMTIGEVETTARARIEMLGRSLSNVSAAGSVYFDSFAATNTSNDLLVARVDQGEVSEFAIEGMDRGAFARATLTNAVLLERPDGENDFVGRANVVRAREGAFQDDVLAIQEVDIEGFRGHAVITEDNEIEPLELLAATFTDEDVVRDIDRQAHQFASRYGRVTVGEGSGLLLEDRSVTPPATMAVRGLTARVEGLDTTQPGSMIPVSLQAEVEQDGRLGLEGAFAPMGAEVDADLQAQVQTLSLSEFTGYAKRFVGYGVESGTLSAQSKIAIERSILDTQNNLRITDLRLNRLRADELSELDAQIGMPLNAAVDLLRDSDGTIVLDVPISGDLTSPELDLTQAVRQAIGNAMKKGVLAVFAPLRLLGKIGGGDKPLDQALQFEELAFEPNAAKLSEDAKTYLDELAKIMGNHPGISISIQGVATGGDVEALRSEQLEELAGQPDPGDSTADDVTAHGPVLVPAGEAEKYVQESDALSQSEPIAPDEPEISDETLRELASNRAAAVQDYLVNSKGIGAARIFVEQPGIERDTNEPGPRVRIRLGGLSG